MKKIPIYAAMLLAAGCGPRPEFDQEVIKCRVDTCIAQYRYPGLTPDKNYILKTQCGIFSSNTPYAIGDSITIKVLTLKK